MPVYKYLPQEYLEGFFQRGSLKIGTLHEYRQIERYGTAIGDDGEGTSRTRFNIDGGGLVDLDGDAPEAKFLRTFIDVPPRSNVKLQLHPDTQLVYVDDSPDAYIFCTTSEFSPEVMKEFGGACFEIIHPEKFFDAVSRVIRHHGKLRFNQPIRYRDRETFWLKPHNVNPALIKDLRYAYQKEVRALWKPKIKSIQPLFVDVPDAVKYCRTVA